MFDLSWDSGGISIYYPGNTPYPPPGSQYNPYPVGYQQQTQISTGTLIVLAVLAYLILKK